MKKFNLLVASFSILVLLNACSSEYHWVKLKSADPNFIKKEDLASKTPEAGNLISENNSTEKTKIEVKESISAPVLPHGQASLNHQTLDQKAMEISKSLSPERISALNSSNLQVRSLAVKETLHEQLMKNANYAKLSTEKQAKIENKISTKIAKAGNSRGDQIWGINKLIVYGLALWVIGVLFLFIFWPLGLLIELAGSIVFIIGLIQQFS